MLNMRKVIIFLAGAYIINFSPSCKTVYQAQSVQYKDYRISQSIAKDSGVIAMLRPYADSVNNSMNAVIAISEIELEKKQPESPLGNLLADVMLEMARQNYKIPVDIAFVNFGGIRLPYLPAGNITRGKIFELAPFDNIIVLQKISGKLLQQLLDHIASKGGWPSSGITWQIKNKKAINVIVGGAPINESAVYTISVVDYLANGGDDCNMLRPVPQINNGYLFRDAVFDYFSILTKKGKKITAKIEKRVSYAD